MTADPITKQDLVAVADYLAEQFNVKFEAIDARFDVIDVRFDSIDGRLDSIDERFDEVDRKIDHLQKETRLEITKLHGEIFDISVDMRAIKERVQNIDGRLTAVENDIKEIYQQLPAAA